MSRLELSYSKSVETLIQRYNAQKRINVISSVSDKRKRRFKTKALQ